MHVVCLFDVQIGLNLSTGLYNYNLEQIARKNVEWAWKRSEPGGYDAFFYIDEKQKKQACQYFSLSSYAKYLLPPRHSGPEKAGARAVVLKGRCPWIHTLTNNRNQRNMKNQQLHPCEGTFDFGSFMRSDG